jgi:hypothetical protein
MNRIQEKEVYHETLLVIGNKRAIESNSLYHGDINV